jgi:uncharacterized protein
MLKNSNYNFFERVLANVRKIIGTLSNYRIITLILLFSFNLVLAQDSLRVSVLANVKKDVIQLRWAVNSPMAWKQSNQYGFRVERYTVVRNNEILSEPEKIILTPQPLKPQPLENWETLATTNNFAAVIAQAIFGKDFQLTGDDAKGVSRFIALAQEAEQRYLVSMYAADLCYPAALLAGWGFEDKTVKQGERYLYRVFSAIPEKVMRIETGSAYVSLNEYQALPQPQELTAIFGDKTVMLTWNYGLLSKVYNAYHVEKSNDGKSFNRLSETPLMNMNSKDGRPADRMYFMDSLVNNSVKTYYRIVGVTSFSEEGPASDVVTGEGLSKLIYVPHIQKAVPDAQGGVHIEWEFDERGNDHIKGFELQRSDSHNGPFAGVLSGISPDKRSVVHNQLQTSNYFVIAAIPTVGEPVMSFPVLVQPIDTIPPAIPSGFQGLVDSLGVVRLSWKPNTENDIYGYRVYRAQHKEEEMIPLNDVAVRETHFTDTIEVRNLNSKIYYAVAALDMRYNQSGKSERVELQKPDVVPPSPPVIINYKITNEGVALEWATGGEESIAAIHLYRNIKSGAGENKLIKTFSDVSVMQYTDNTIESNRIYSYTLKVVTASGLSSDPSPAVTVRTTAKAGTAGKFISFTAQVNKKKKHIELTWKHDMTGVKEFQVYKGEAGKHISLWRVVKGFEHKLEDSEVKLGVAYEYIIKAVLEDGKSGGVAKITISI